MIAHQQTRRNLSAGELIFANSMVAEEIKLENEEKMLEGTYKSHEVRKNGCVHMDTPKERDRLTNTREQVAKLSGVGTVDRFNKVMNSNDEKLKKIVLSIEVSINAGYEKIRETIQTRIRFLKTLSKPISDKEVLAIQIL